MPFTFDAASAQPADGATTFDPSSAQEVKPRGPIGEIANQLKAGAVVDLPKMAGQALQYASDKGRPVYELGKRIADAAEHRGENPDLQPDEANHNIITNSLAAGARMIPQSVVPAAAVGAGLAALPLSPGVALGGAAVLGSLPTAMSQGQDTLDKAEKAGVPEDVAVEAARKTAAIEGAGEAIGTYVGGKLVTGVGRTIGDYIARKLGKVPASEALGQATSGAVIKPWAKKIPETALVETGTEMGQNAGEAYVEQQAGIDTKEPWQAAKEAIGPTLGMTALLAPFGLAGHYVASQQRMKRAQTLSSADAEPIERLSAAAEIQRDIAQVDPEAARSFGQHVAEAVTNKAPLPIGDHLLEPPAPVGPVTSALRTQPGMDPNQHLDEAGNIAAPLPPDAGVPPAAAPVVAPVEAAAAAPQQSADLVDHSLAPTDLQAHGAATSPFNARKEPTEGQKGAGNYAMGHTRIAGMGFSLENPEGSTRSGTNDDGSTWNTDMVGAHYGYQKGTQGADSTAKKKQGRDVFIKAGTPADWKGTPFVVDQVDPKTGLFDEHKTIIGADSEGEAKRIYLSHYEAGWQGLGAITPMSLPEFKKWTYNHDTRNAPVNPEVPTRDHPASAPAQGEAQPAAPAGFDVESATLHTEGQAAGPGEAGGAAAAQSDLNAAVGDLKQLAGADTAALKAGGEATKPAANPSEVVNSGQTPSEQAAPETDESGPVGRNGVPISQGGKPFAKKLNAIQHQSKHMPQGRVIKSGDGYAVRPVTDRELQAHTEAGKRRDAAGRAAAWEKNPLIAWLGEHGLFHEKGNPRSTKSDLSPDKNPFTPHGPLFRRTGKQLDVLAASAAQAGFLPRGTEDESQLSELVSRALRGERIAPVYGEGQAEAEAQRRAPSEPSEEDEQAALEDRLEREAIQAADDLTSQQLDTLADLWDSAENATEEDAMRALGFTEDEIRATRQTAPGPEAESRNGRTSTGQPEATGPPQGAAPGEGAQDREVAPAPKRRDKTSIPPKAAFWRIALGNPREGEVGRNLGYEKDEAGNDVVRLQFPDGEERTYPPLALFPAPHEAKKEREAKKAAAKGQEGPATPKTPLGAKVDKAAAPKTTKGRPNAIAGAKLEKMQREEEARQKKVDETFDSFAGKPRPTNVAPAVTANVAGVNVWAAREYPAGREVAQGLRAGDFGSIAKAASALSPMVPNNSVIIPMPGRTGKPSAAMLELANVIAEASGSTVVDVLRGKPRESLYEAKKAGKDVSKIDVAMSVTDPDAIPRERGREVFVLDNVVATGATADAASRALAGVKPIILAYAVDRQALEPVQPEAKPAAPEAKKVDPDELRAKADLQNALADLAMFVTKPGRMNIVPEDEAKLMPILTRVFDAAFRLGYIKFKQAAKFVLKTIREQVSPELADSITIDHLQGAYIAMGGKYRDKGAEPAKAVVGVESKDEIEAESDHVPGADVNVERDSEGAAPRPAVGGAFPGQPAGNGAPSGAAGQGAGAQGGGRQDHPSVSTGGPSVGGERGDQHLPGGALSPEHAIEHAGDLFGERGSDDRVAGISPDPVPAASVAAAAGGNREVAKRRAQREADSLAVKHADLENVRATLPYLLEGQQEDVYKAEVRHAKPDGYGMLFSNGTGTGKTFLGLGVIKRHVRAGKSNVLVVVPDDKIAEDWIGSGAAMGLTIGQLADTKSAGKGVVITTYANLGQNDDLASRDWDLIIPDESHMLMQDKDGTPTSYLQNLRAIALHADGAYRRAEMLHAELFGHLSHVTRDVNSASRDYNAASDERARPALKKKLDDLTTRQRELEAKWRAALDAVKADVAARQGAKRPRLVFLSATPFAYENTIDWANGFLFDYNKDYPYKDEGRGYNTPDPRQHFFITHLGYRMRYGKLTRPDDKVDSGLMQRQFNGWLKKQGVLAGRVLDVPADYDRRFVLIDSAIGNRIDAALDWLSDRSWGEQQIPGMSDVRAAIDERFDYLSRRFLLEAIKAEAVIPIVKKHLSLGRKVVVFHDYNVGGGHNPFKLQSRAAEAGKLDTPEKERAAAFNSALAQFQAEFADLIASGFEKMRSPIEAFRASFGDELLLINGREKPREVLQRYRRFQDDGSGPLVALVQADKNKGWSGHDTTGKHQRVLINLGQPTQPTRSIQQEGRIYRTGNISDAVFRYLNTGTNWEKWAFATTIASRASTAENLSMGELARALKDAYIAAFEESADFPPGHEGEGKGGKERDRLANAALSEWDRAKAFYWGTQKKTAKTKAADGKDYFATPEPLGLKMAQWASAYPGEHALEPSAGHGAIARWLPELARRVAIEPSAALRARLAMVFDGKIIEGTFEGHDTAANKYHAIVMNPPFGVGGKLAMEHLEKAVQHLQDGGRIVALLPQGPMADKRLDQFLYGKDVRKAKPLGETSRVGPYYAGDTVRVDSDDNTYRIERMSDRGLMLRQVHANGESNFAVAFRSHYLKEIVKAGPRTEEFAPGKDLRLLADVKLPGVTFERAATSVMAHVIVLQKGGTAVPQQITRDLRGVDGINDLFDRLENIEVAPRPAPDQDARTAPAPATPVVPGSTQLPPVDPSALIEHTTQKGKVIRGVVRSDLTLVQAKAIDPYTFKKDGGFFIREKYLQGGNTAQEERAVYAVNEPEKNYDVDLFGHDFELTAPAAPLPSRRRSKPAAAMQPNVIALRQNERTPGVYYTSAHLVQVGTRMLPNAKIDSWAQATRALGYLVHGAVEHFDVLITDADGTPMAMVGSFKGTTTQASVYPGTIVAEALRIKGARYAWGVHNHPSGTAQLSRADEALSQTVKAAFTGSPVEWRGIAAVARQRDGAVEWQATEGADYARGEFTLRDEDAVYPVPIVERQLVKQGHGGSFGSPEDVKRRAPEISGGRAGIMVLNAQNQLSAWIPGAPEVFATAQGEQWAALVNGMAEANGSSVILINPGSSVGMAMARATAATQQLKGRLALLDVRVLDQLDPIANISFAERGLLEPATKRDNYAREPMDDYTAAAIFERMVSQEQQAVHAALLNWNDSELQDGRIVQYVGRERHTRDDEFNGADEIAPREFLEWLASDAAPAVSKDADWQATVQRLRAFAPALSAYSPAEALQKQEREEAAKKKEEAERAAKPKDTSKLTGEQVDLFNPQGGLFRQGGAPAGGMTHAAIDKAVRSLTRDWARKPPIHVIDDMSQAPESTAADWEKHHAPGDGALPRGFFVRGEIYLLAPHMRSLEDVRRTLYHEALGHYGLEGVYGKQLASVLDMVARLRPQEIAAKATQYRLNVANEADRRIAAEEWLAEQAQEHPELGWVRRLVAAVRTWLRDHGIIDAAVTDDEIVRDYILPARDWVKRARDPRATFTLATQFAQSDDVYAMTLEQAKAEAQQLAPRVKAAYEKGNTALAERLDARLDALHRRLEDGYSEVEEDALSPSVVPDSAEFERLRKTLGLDGHIEQAEGDEEADLVRDLGNRYVDLTTGNDSQFYSTTAERANLLRALLSDYEHRHGGLRTGLTDEQVMAAGKDAAEYVHSKQRGARFMSAAIGTLDPAQEQSLRNVGGIVQAKTLAERMAQLRANLATKVAQGLVDSFAPIKQYDQRAYMLARMSKGGDATMEAALLYGKVFLDGDAPNVDIRDGGFVKVLASLKGEHDRFLWWIAAKRAARLAADGRENLFTKGDISNLQTLSAGNFKDGTARLPAFEAAERELNAYNEAVLKMALDSGLITQEAFDVMKDQPYVPFYRVMDDEGGLKFTSRGGLVNQYAYKTLKGGKEKLNNDLLQNMLLNWSHVFTASARNRAAAATIDTAMGLGIAYPAPFGAKGTVAVREGGIPKHFVIEDPYLLEAVSALTYAPSELLKPLAAAKKWLTLGVTANPAFKVRNLVRDSVSAAAQSDLSYNVFANIANGWKGTDKTTQVYASMLAAGGMMRFGTTENSDRVRRQIEVLGGQLLDKQGWEKLTHQIANVWEAYQELGDRGENVNRAALYQRLVDKGHSHADAAFMARDLLDFSMSGSWPLVRFLTQTVPFFNARLQGLYKLGRAAAEDPRRAAIVTGAVVLASLGLYAAYGDDDDWKKREDWDRDTYWWFKIGGQAFRIPKPFEIGSIGTIAERTAELAFEDEMTFARYRKRISNMIFQTFSFDPTPQILKPIVDVYANKDSFTEKPIETSAEQKLQPTDRVGERTSEAARLLGQLGLPNPAELAKGNWAELSPKQVDFLLHGYFGWMATAALTMSDYSIRPLTDRGARPAMQLRDVFLAGNFVETLPSNTSRYVTQMYEQSQAIEQAFNSWQQALRRGDTAEVASIFERENAKIRKHPQVEILKRAEGVIHSQVRRTEADKALTPDEKRARLDELQRRADALARPLGPPQ